MSLVKQIYQTNLSHSNLFLFKKNCSVQISFAPLAFGKTKPTHGPWWPPFAPGLYCVVRNVKSMTCWGQPVPGWWPPPWRGSLYCIPGWWPPPWRGSPCWIASQTLSPPTHCWWRSKEIFSQSNYLFLLDFFFMIP